MGRSILTISLPLLALKEKKVRRKRNSNSPNEYPTTSFQWPIPLQLANIQGCHFPSAHWFLFFQVSPSLLDPADISVILLFSYLVHMLKLYISAIFLEHLKSVAYNSALNISSIRCCCFLYFNPLTLLNKIANDIKLCEIANHRNTNYNSQE